MSSHVQIVQFVHPGFEYDGVEQLGGRHIRSGVMAWKPGNSKHDRKFMVTSGSVPDPASGRDHREIDIAFWGEWEGPSVFWKIDGAPGRPKPSVIHAPFRPARVPRYEVQNTDPMVFGDAFIYSNCLQHAYSSLRALPIGSIVLFGRHGRVAGRPAFSLDTCLVVENVELLPPLPFDAETYGRDILKDAVLSPLFSEGAADPFAVYSGSMRTAGSDPPFSFFPARLFDGDPFFARPELMPTGALEGVISPANMQGIKSRTVSPAERDAIWHEVAQQVATQGCSLGYHAAAPPLLDLESAESAARRPPARLA